MAGLDAPAFPMPSTFDEVIEYMRMLIQEDHHYKTVVIDTLSSLEKLIFAKTCKDAGKTSIEDFGYAKGYVHAMTHWNKIIDGMDRLRNKGIAPVLLAHSEIRTVNDPIVDAYDKYILRLHKHPAAMITQWCDNIFFGTHRTVVKKQGEGFNQTSKGIGQGERVVFTEDRPAFMAKSRIALPFEIEIPKINGWAAVAQHFNLKKKEVVNNG